VPAASRCLYGLDAVSINDLLLSDLSDDYSFGALIRRHFRFVLELNPYSDHLSGVRVLCRCTQHGVLMLR
jgi:hypothetical protein